jgi:hypothetical protein
LKNDYTIINTTLLRGKKMNNVTFYKDVDRELAKQATIEKHQRKLKHHAESNVCKRARQKHYVDKINMAFEKCKKVGFLGVIS